MVGRAALCELEGSSGGQPGLPGTFSGGGGVQALGPLTSSWKCVSWWTAWGHLFWLLSTEEDTLHSNRDDALFVCWEIKGL